VDPAQRLNEQPRLPAGTRCHAAGQQSSRETWRRRHAARIQYDRLRKCGRSAYAALLVPGLSQKYVELLKEALPAAARFGVIASPANPVPENRRELEAAAKALALSVSFLPVSGVFRAVCPGKWYPLPQLYRCLKPLQVSAKQR